MPQRMSLTLDPLNRDYLQQRATWNRRSMAAEINTILDHLRATEAEGWKPPADFLEERKSVIDQATSDEDCRDCGRLGARFGAWPRTDDPSLMETVALCPACTAARLAQP